MNLCKFSAELKRRNVYKVAIAYAVIARLLMQIAGHAGSFLRKVSPKKASVIALARSNQSRERKVSSVAS